MDAIDAPSLSGCRQVDEIEGGNVKPFKQSQEALTFSSEQTDLNVTIVSMTGMVVINFTAKQGQTETVYLSQFPSGVYIINVNNTSYKFTKR